MAWQQQSYGQGYYPGGYPAQPPPGGYYNPQQPGPGYPQPGFGFPQQPGMGYPPIGMGGPMDPGIGFHYPADVEIGGASGPKDEGPTVNGMDFTEKTVRAGFIRKVYSILMVQLMVTTGIIALITLNRDVKMWIRRNPSALYASMGVSFVLLLAMACCESVRRKSPTNIICLGLFTLAKGFMLGFIASTYSPMSVLLAVGITAVICFSLTAFSFQTKFDMTAKNGILFICLIVFFLFGILMIFLRDVIPYSNIIYACLGALLFSAYLVYDTQMMMGGNKKYSLSPEEYIFAALNLYLDIVHIFIYILSIVGSRGD